MPLLELSDLRKRYGGIVALDGADLALEAGEVHVLIGANGCGKSTLCKVIAGSVLPDSGVLRIDGAERRFRSPREAAAAGVGVFYQELSLVPSLSVEDNLLLGREPRRFGLVDRRAVRREAERQLALFAGALGPELAPDSRVADLSADQRQVVEILKVLGEDARLILFDEPTSSLDRRQVAIFFELVRALKREGRTVVFISHRMDEIFEIGDRVSVMRDGRVVETTAVADTDPGRIVRAMVGGEAAAGGAPGAAPGTAPAPARPGDATLLRVDGLSAPRVDGVSLELRAGEILGLGGLHGQGQSALLRGLFGIEPGVRGRIEVEGRPLRRPTPADSIRAGLAYISGDRGRDGVALLRPILENLAYGLVTREGGVAFPRGRVAGRLGPVVERLGLRFGSLSDPVRSLSGGNQQKVVIGRWLATAPRVILLDDPTKGIDVNAKADLFRMVRELAEAGAAILLYSSEDGELLGHAERVLVFNGGRIVRELSGEGLTRHALNEAAYATPGATPGAEAGAAA